MSLVDNVVAGVIPSDDRPAGQVSDAWAHIRRCYKIIERPRPLPLMIQAKEGFAAVMAEHIEAPVDPAPDEQHVWEKEE